MDHVIRTTSQLRFLLVAFRKAQKLGQSGLAAKLGVTQQALSALERDPSSASFERLFNLLSTLHVDIVLRTRDPASARQASSREPTRLSPKKKPAHSDAPAVEASSRQVASTALIKPASGKKQSKTGERQSDPLHEASKPPSKSATTKQDKW